MILTLSSLALRKGVTWRKGHWSSSLSQEQVVVYTNRVLPDALSPPPFPSPFGSLGVFHAHVQIPGDGW